MTTRVNAIEQCFLVVLCKVVLAFESMDEVLKCDPVFQVSFKGRVSSRSFEGSIDVSLSTSQVYHLRYLVR